MCFESSWKSKANIREETNRNEDPLCHIIAFEWKVQIFKKPYLCKHQQARFRHWSSRQSERRFRNKGCCRSAAALGWIVRASAGSDRLFASRPFRISFAYSNHSRWEYCCSAISVEKEDIMESLCLLSINVVWLEKIRTNTFTIWNANFYVSPCKK